MDSLSGELKKAKHDTTRLRLLVLLSTESDINDLLQYSEPAIKIADALLKNDKNLSEDQRILIISQKAAAVSNIGFMHQHQGNIDLALDYYKKVMVMQKEINDMTGLAISYNNIGIVYKDRGDILNALDYYQRSLILYEAVGDKNGVANLLNNFGYIFQQQGNVEKALDYYGRSLKIREEIGDKKGTAQSLNNIASIYHSQKDEKSALEYYQRSLNIRKAIGDKQGISASLNNIGMVYGSKGEYETALGFYQQSLKLREEIRDKQGTATALNNIGNMYDKLNDITKALDYLLKSLKLRNELGDKQGLAASHTNVGSLYLKMACSEKDQARKQKYYILSNSYLDSSLVISKKLGYPLNIRNAENALAKLDSARGNYTKALAHFQQFIIYRDSLNNEETRKASFKNQLKYEFDKKEAVLKEQEAREREVAEEKNLKQKIVIYSVAAGLFLVLVFAIYVFRSLHITRKQKILIEIKNKETELQKEVIEEKQKEILDSIHYAKRIQTALITNERYIDKNLNRLQKV